MTQPDDPGVHPPLTPEVQSLIRVLGRHTRPEDMKLSEVARTRKAIARFERDNEAPIVDVNE